MADRTSNLRAQTPRSIQLGTTQVKVVTRRTSAGNRNFQEIFYTNTANNTPVTMHVTKRQSSDDSLSFTSPYTPQQVQYGNIAPELSEISRPGKMPVVAFSRFRSRELSFRFLVAVPNDGLFTPVDDSIELLFDIANTARPVYFTNMDKQISNPLGKDDASKNIFWSIRDMSFNSIRRNESNQITACEVDMALVENVNPRAVVAELPKIVYTETPNVPKPKPGSPVETDFLNYTVVRSLRGASDAGRRNIDTEFDVP